MQITRSPLELAPKAQNDPQKIETVSRQLEGQFAQMLVKSMRDASFGDSLFPGENQTFRDMYDQQMSKALTEGKGLGLQAMIARQLGGGQDAAGTGQVNTALDAGTASQAYPLAQAKAAKAYSLIARGRDAAAAGVAGHSEAALAQSREAVTAQTLDLIAGRDSSTAIGTGSRTDASATPEDWSSLDDRWLGTGGVAVDDSAAASAGSAAASALGERTPEGFVARIWHHAQKAAQELGVDPRALVAQAALETGWGKRGISRGNGSDSNNLFGIKASGWKGDAVTTGTHEYVNGVKTSETASFRAYSSAADSFADYVRLLKNSDRYQQALTAGKDIKGFARGLQKAGYATDPGYAAKIAAIAHGPTIDRAVAAISQYAGQSTGADLSRTFASTAGVGNLR
ncbi:flagellar biosynthesis protein FlgJ [Stenotrophomonas panacihumi]|uniref:Peptidoglycan hydrolase FlgJ n=1 Tax=Stenotrophomonas panacihumi TaxID=676599 RepID=A0A0R0AAA6_9GAMM|nr:flagellar assembly peptidoglycan hydrolase FlgJ [Stenotrophomonas panacihumi]KRG38295.1 flagellar biosynthesis protein FlgJ [Stenotrophomonas panacihumi]PTN55561.1 flagellar assembly peptidoglycan hydrolase FlgJ [Stenotrophomonas panacihumi]